MNETLNTFKSEDGRQVQRYRLARLLPLYLAAYAVLLCGLASYVTSTDSAFGVRGLLVVLVGMGVSIFCRLRQLRQNTMFGILAGMVVVLIFWVTVSGESPLNQLMVFMANGREQGPGLMLAWFVMLYSFAMIADEVIIFSVVPSIALLGLMASENINSEIVIYFIGLVLSAVFLLVYENLLSRMPEPGANAAGPAGGINATDTPLLPRADARMPAVTPFSPAQAEGGPVPDVRSSLLLAVVVMSLALMVGLGASMPLQMLGQTISEHTPQINMPASTEFTAEVTNRYVNQLQLTGAPPHLSDRMVMQIRAPRPYYWRGKVFDRYLGSSWSGSPMKTMLDEDGDGYQWPKKLHAGPANNEAKGRTPVLQDVTTFDPPLGGMLVAAAEPEWISTHHTVYQDGNRSLQIDDMRNAIHYVVESRVPAEDGPELRKAGTHFPQALKAANTQVPEDGREARRAIALQVTAGKTTEYDKVKALETYLRDNFSYTLTPPRTPSSDDAVTFFLTQSKEGYCEIFASSMAVLCREIGIPARLATGFAPGVWRSYPGGRRGTAILREKDLHAWTEVYFPGYGWVPFDPTSSREAKVSWAASFREYLGMLFSHFNRQSTGPWLVLLSIMAIGAFLVKSYGVDPVRTSTWWRVLWARYQRDLTPEQRWDLLYARAHRRLKRWAGLKAAHQTPYEYARQARQALPPDAADAFDAVTDLYVSRAFQRGGPDAAAMEEMARLDTELRQALRSAPRPERAPARA